MIETVYRFKTITSLLYFAISLVCFFSFQTKYGPAPFLHLTELWSVYKIFSVILIYLAGERWAGEEAENLFQANSDGMTPGTKYILVPYGFLCISSGKKWAEHTLVLDVIYKR